MAHKTLRAEIVETLEQVGEKDWERFRYQLVDRKGEPRVPLCKVERKSRARITDVMVSTFTEEIALRVTVEVLRMIRCNQQAKDLEIRTQTRVKNGDPIFRRTSAQTLDLNPSQEALDLTSKPQNKCAFEGIHENSSPEEVEESAKKSVIAKGLDSFNPFVILSEHFILLNKYFSKTFKWLLENDLMFVIETVAHHQMMKEDLFKDQASLMANKDALARYAMSYSEVAELIRDYRQKVKQENGASCTANHKLHR